MERERRFLEDQRRSEQANQERRSIVLDRTQSAIQMSLTVINIFNLLRATEQKKHYLN